MKLKKEIVIKANNQDEINFYMKYYYDLGYECISDIYFPDDESWYALTFRKKR